MGQVSLLSLPCILLVVYSSCCSVILLLSAVRRLGMGSTRGWNPEAVLATTDLDPQIQKHMQKVSQYSSEASPSLLIRFSLSSA